MDRRNSILKLAGSFVHRFIFVFYCLILVGGHGAAAAREVIKCPDAVTASRSQNMYKDWGLYEKGPGKLSGAWIMRLGDHYEETPDPVKAMQSETSEKRTATEFFRLNSLVGKPWTLYCEYGGKVTENTLLWRELPRLFTTCEIKEHQSKTGKEIEAYCK